MRCTTDGPWPIALRTGSTSPREMTTVVACTTTWRIEDGRLVPAEPEARWKPSETPTKLGVVELSGDLDYRRQGVAMVVLGEACAPNGKPVTQHEISVTCGNLKHSSRVIGDRVWEKSWTRLRISDPKPFTTMPITNDRAFGGVAVMPDLGMPHAVNPVGRGFHAVADTVVGGALPNLEDPAAPITAWSDRPVPSLWYKPAGGPSVANPPADAIAYTAAVAAAVILDAPPALCTTVEALGPDVRLDGFDPGGPLVMPLPPAGKGWCSVQIGERRSRFLLRPARIVAMPASRALAVTYAARFRWLMDPKDDRSVVVGWKD